MSLDRSEIVCAHVPLADVVADVLSDVSRAVADDETYGKRRRSMLLRLTMMFRARFTYAYRIR